MIAFQMTPMHLIAHIWILHMKVVMLTGMEIENQVPSTPKAPTTGLHLAPNLVQNVAEVGQSKSPQSDRLFPSVKPYSKASDSISGKASQVLWSRGLQGNPKAKIASTQFYSVPRIILTSLNVSNLFKHAYTLGFHNSLILKVIAFCILNPSIFHFSFYMFKNWLIISLSAS